MKAKLKKEKELREKKREKEHEKVLSGILELKKWKAAKSRERES